jgi:hypothetical protein
MINKLERSSFGQAQTRFQGSNANLIGRPFVGHKIKDLLTSWISTSLQKLCIYDGIGYGGKCPLRHGLVMITLVTRQY